MKKIITILLMGFSLFLTGCDKKNDNKIVIAEVTHSVFYAPQYVARSEGIFKKYDLDVSVILTPGADKVMSAILSKEAQIGLMGPEASIYVYNQGRDDYAISFAQLTKKDGSFLLGREYVDNFSLDMLNGSSIIAGREGGMPLMVLEYILKSNGLEIKRNDSSANINIRSDIQFNAMSGAFIRGEGDYVSLFEPNASELEKNGNGYILASLGELSGDIPYTCYASIKSYIKKNSDKLERFTKAIYEAQMWVYSHTPLEIAESIKGYFTENSVSELEVYVKRYMDIRAWASDPLLTVEGFNKLNDIMIMAGEIDARADYSKLVDTEFANKAIKTL